MRLELVLPENAVDGCRRNVKVPSQRSRAPAREPLSRRLADRFDDPLKSLAHHECCAVDPHEGDPLIRFLEGVGPRS